MFKITTRKGLCFGAVVALATTLFSGAPAAQAAVAPITLTGNDSYGTYTVPFGTNFDLKSWVTNTALGGATGNWWWNDINDHSQGTTSEGLKYNVKNVSDNSNSADIRYGVGSGDWNTSYGPYNNYLTNGADYTYDAQDYGYSTQQNDFAVSAMNYHNNTPLKIQVTAWVDSNHDGAVSPNEESAVQTITWVDPASLTSTTKIADAYVGQDAIEADVTFSNKDINLEQVATSMRDGWDYEGYYGEEEASVFGVAWTRNTTDGSFTGYDNYDSSKSPDFYGSNNYDLVRYDPDLKAVVFPWTSNINDSSNDVASGLYSAQLYTWFDADFTNGYDNWSKLGTSAHATVAADVVNHVGKVTTALGSNVINDGDGNNGNFVARSGTKSITYTATVYKADVSSTNDTPVGAGIVSGFEIYDNNLQYGSSITAGGKTLISHGEALYIPATTDANGKISITVTASAVDGDSIGVYAYSRTHYSSDANTQWQDASFQVYANPGDDRAIAVGASTSVTYRIEDQFNQPAGSDYQLRVVRDSCSSRDTEASWSYAVPVSNGAATVSIKDNGAGYGRDCVYADLDKKLSGGGFSYTWNSYSFYLYYTDAALITPTAVTASVNYDGVLTKPNALSNLSGFVASNSNQEYTLDDGLTYEWSTDNAYTTSVTTDANDQLAVSGTVSSDLVDAAFVPVTISLPGAVFGTSANKNTDPCWNCDWSTAKDSITTYTDVNGDYEVFIYSDVPGKQTITVTSGGKSKTVDVTFAQSTPKSVALSVAGGAASAQSGRSVPVAATVKDANGHAVSGVTVTFAAVGGSGSLSNSTAVTSSSGVATVNYVTGVSDTGSVDFTATVGDLTVAKATVSFVRSTGNVTQNKKGTMTAHWSNAKGQSILVTVDGYRRYNQTELADAANFFSKHLKKGRHTINLYIGGVLIDSLKFTVKK